MTQQVRALREAEFKRRVEIKAKRIDWSCLTPDPQHAISPESDSQPHPSAD